MEEKNRKRDYKKESKRNKELYCRVLADIDKPLGLMLKRKLKIDNISISKWITENAIKYLEKN